MRVNMADNLRSINILGVRVDRVDMAILLERIEELLSLSRQELIVTLNPEFIMYALQDKTFHQIIRSAAVVIPDGIGVIWAAKISGRKLIERVAGVDLVWEIARLSAIKGYKLFLLGGRAGVADEAKIRLVTIYPNLRVEAYSPPMTTVFSADENNRMINLINAFNPDFLLVALGPPRQEKWIMHHRERLNFKIGIGVGGSLDFIARRIKRAPLWIQKGNLEWLHRLIMEPQRIKRFYRILPRFIFLVMREKYRK